MNYYEEIEKLVKQFCNEIPMPNDRGEYLRIGKKVSNLYSESNSLGAQGVDDTDKRIVDIYEEIKKILN